MGYYSRRSRRWPEYVSVAEKKKQAEKHVEKLKKKGTQLHPVLLEGRSIAKTFWGKAWCENLESYSDFSNRLPRGRSYVRNGSVIDLQITKGLIQAQVSGSSIYHVKIEIQSIASSLWKDLIGLCTGKIESLIELLQGKFSKSVMQILSNKEHGLFPKPKEISMSCSCPDYAGMCKHIAAVLYGVGARLDEQPEYLFQLRHVDPLDLLASTTPTPLLSQEAEGLQEEDLSELFGIELDGQEISKPSTKKKASAKKRSTKKKAAKKAVTSKKKQ